MQTFDGKKSRDLLVVLINVLQQDPIRPNAQPAVYSPGPRGPLVGVELLQRFLYALQAVLGLLGHGAPQVQNPAPTDRSRLRHLGGPLGKQTNEMTLQRT
jgi:hypothetical protein